jgi:hypothetical protein
VSQTQQVKVQPQNEARLSDALTGQSVSQALAAEADPYASPKTRRTSRNRIWCSGSPV